MKTIIKCIASLSCSFLIYQLYENSTDYKFTIAYLGGAIVMSVFILVGDYISK